MMRQVNNYPVGYTPLDGYNLISLPFNQSFTLGPLDRWVQVQVHGILAATFVYVIVGPPGTYPGVTPNQRPLPEAVTPLALPPGCRLTLTNTAAGTCAATLIYREL